MWRRLKETFQEVGKAFIYYEVASLAAGVAFFAALSLFPLMLALIAGVGYFFEFVQRGQNARDEIMATVSQQMSPQLAGELGKVLGGVQDRALVNGPIAGLALFFTASLVFTQVDRAFIRIWDVRLRRKKKSLWLAVKRMILIKARSLALLGGSCLLVVAVFVGGLILRAVTGIKREWFPDVPTLPGFGSLLIGVTINVLAFGFLYRFLSKERVGWRLCFESALVTAALWELGSRLLTLASFGANYSAYGLIGSFLVVLLWIYYNVMVFLLGALIVRVGTRPLVDWNGVEEDGDEVDLDGG